MELVETSLDRRQFQRIRYDECADYSKKHLKSKFATRIYLSLFSLSLTWREERREENREKNLKKHGIL